MKIFNITRTPCEVVEDITINSQDFDNYSTTQELINDLKNKLNKHLRDEYELHDAIGDIKLDNEVLIVNYGSTESNDKYFVRFDYDDPYIKIRILTNSKINIIKGDD